MRINFRSFVLASAAIAATAIATVPAHAATMGSANLNVPFSFNIDGKTMPAGNYAIKCDASGNFIKLQSEDGSITYNWVARSIGNTDHRVTLRFDQRGGAKDLQSVQYGTLTTPRLDRKLSPREREAQEVVSGQ
jgi:hypothetical protein